MLYIMVWIDEEEKWYYFINDFDSSQFSNGYVAYYIEANDGIIVSDSWEELNEGKKIITCYDLALWENQ